jgi:hypothetical protein
MDIPRDYHVRVAYDFVGASKARAIKGYHKNDFNLAKSKDVTYPVFCGVEGFEVGGNYLKFTADDHNFNVEVTGFDENRDVIVDVISKVVKYEAV